MSTSIRGGQLGGESKAIAAALKRTPVKKRLKARVTLI